MTLLSIFNVFHSVHNLHSSPEKLYRFRLASKSGPSRQEFIFSCSTFKIYAAGGSAMSSESKQFLPQG